MRSLARSAVAALVAVLLITAPASAQQRAAPDGPDAEVSADGAVLWDPLDGRVLWGRAASRPRRMASTTKIMTALLAVEAGTVDDTVTVSATAAAADDVPGAATLGLRAGQRVEMEDLLTALMMRSGNDAAAVVAEHVAGSEAAFVEQMNVRAAELGLDDTSFVDASGLTDSAAHHASPRDLARLGEIAMADPAFADLVDDYRATLPDFGTLVSRNLLLDSYRGATGIKTGYTSLAGLCLVASATRDGRTLYTAVLGSDDNFADTRALLDHGFADFEVASAEDVAVGPYRTAAGDIPTRLVDAAPHTVPVDGTVRVRAALLPEPTGPVRRGTRLGRAELVVDGEVIDTAGIEADGPAPTGATDGPAASAGAAIEDAVRAFARATPRRVDVPTGG
jgi:D-alanyl-D-alanine carboxypeptidase (penicillin-binding protein 5/6)